jgi:hypothetical protein
MVIYSFLYLFSFIGKLHVFAMDCKQRIRLNLPISALYLHFSVLSPFQRFISISAFYPHFSVVSPFQRFIPISAFYSHFSVLSPFQRFIPISAFYPHFSVLSPFQRETRCCGTVHERKANYDCCGPKYYDTRIQSCADFYTLVDN